MRLTVIGCSGSFPGPESAASCYLLEAPWPDGPKETFRMLLDVGSGAFGTLQAHVDPRSIDAVVVTHLHPDHCHDLCGFHVFLKYHPDGAIDPIPVLGPAGAAERLVAAYGMTPGTDMSGQFDFREFPDHAIELGPLMVETAPVDHPVETRAVRVSPTAGGPVLVYSGDTGPCDALTGLAKGADLLLVEASYLEGGVNPAHLHMSGREAAEIASQAEVAQLMLTHIPPWHDAERVLVEAMPHFAGPVRLARPGLALEL